MCYDVAVADWGWAPSEFWDASPQEFFAFANRKLQRNPPMAAPGSKLTRGEFARLKELANA